jgi:hypothetical protein
MVGFQQLVQQDAVVVQAVLICSTFIGLAWKLHSYVDKLLTNHFAHFEERLLDALNKQTAAIVTAILQGKK